MGRRHILIVDDNRALAENVGELLEDLDATVVFASTAEEAERASRDHRFDLAILDVRLPADRSGVELVPVIREHSPDGEIMLMTGNATLDTAIAAVRHGVYAYVQKPFDPDDLVALARRALEQVMLRRDRDELEQRAAEAEAMAALGRLTAALAHEIRNPLNAAKLQLEVMERAARRSSDPEMERAVADRTRLVKGDLDRLSRLLDEFLGLARPGHLERARVDVVAMMKELFELEAPVCEEAGIALALDVDPNVGAISADEGRVRQVIVNLTVNAIDALRPRGSGRVWLGARRTTSGEVELRVEDDGPGIDPSIAASVFRPFVTRKIGGTGLGLAIVKQLVELQGGRVALTARDGGGTVASAVFPPVSARTASPEAD